jgi:hypothetical protein
LKIMEIRIRQMGDFLKTFIPLTNEYLKQFLFPVSQFSFNVHI